MTLLRRLVLVLCWAFLYINYSNAQQVDTTGNLVDNGAWNNAVYQNSLTCWAAGDPGYCGPNPIVSPSGNINFSYGTVDLYQLKTIATALPNSGTGLVVNGFNFGFMAKNGNGWDNGNQDFLSAYVKFYTTKGIQGPEYDYTAITNSRYNWTSFNFSETFTSTWPVPELSSVKYGFVGRDNNFWQGPYGPEIYNVSFSLKYSVDPCSTNQFYSSSCAGYFDALAKLAPASITSTDTVFAYTPPPPPPLEPGAIPPPPQAQQPPPPGAPQTANNPPPGTQQPQGPGPQGPGPQAGPQERSVGAPANLAVAPQAAQEKSVASPVNLSFALNLVAKNAQREKEVEQQVVTAALAEAQSASTKAQSETTQTVAALNAMSTQSSETGQAMATTAQASGGTNTSTKTQSGPQAQQANTVAATSSTVSILQQQTQASSVIGLQVSNVTLLQQSTQTTQVINNTQAPVLQSYQLQESTSVNYSLAVQPQQIFVAPVSEAAQTQTFAMYTPSSQQKQADTEVIQTTPTHISDRSNPLREILEAAPVVLSDFSEQRTDNKNKVVQTNELAAGVDLTTIATTPQGYTNYTNLALKDASFYEIKEVYKNQKVVDNIRVLRGLGSDKKHQDLVNLQYR